jgi:hypothetical protein
MSQAASKAQANGAGTVVSIGGVTGATGSETFTPLGEITDAKFSGIKMATTDVSTFAANVKRKLGTIADYGTFTFTTLRVSNDPGQAAVIAACATGSLYDFTIQLVPNAAAGQVTTGDLIKFSGIVTEAGGFDLSLTKQADATVTIEIDGAWVITEGA